MSLEPFGFAQGRPGERHFDGVEVWAVGRQKQEPGTALLQKSLGLCALMAGEIVEDGLGDRDSRFLVAGGSISLICAKPRPVSPMRGFCRFWLFLAGPWQLNFEGHTFRQGVATDP